MILQLVSDLESDLRNIEDLGLDADNDFPWQVHTLPTRGGGGSGVAKKLQKKDGVSKTF